MFKKLLLAASAALTFAACGTTDQIDNAFDCLQVCNRYRDCFDSNYDTEGCRERCRDNSNEVKDIQRQADDCENCMDDKSCTSTAFSCGSTCAGIVP